MHNSPERPKPQKVPTIKRPKYKTSQASKCPKPQNIPTLKTSQASKHLKPQNIPTIKHLNSKKSQVYNISSLKTSPAIMEKIAFLK